MTLKNDINRLHEPVPTFGLSVPEFAEWADVSRGTAWKLVWTKALGHKKIGNQVRILQCHIDDYLARSVKAVEPRETARLARLRKEAELERKRQRAKSEANKDVKATVRGDDSAA